MRRHLDPHAAILHPAITADAFPAIAGGIEVSVRRYRDGMALPVLGAKAVIAVPAAAIGRRMRVLRDRDRPHLRLGVRRRKQQRANREEI